MTEDFMISLGEFERRHGINKGTVSKRARELGYDTSAGLSQEAYTALKADFKVPDQPDPEPQPDPKTPVSPTHVLPDHFFHASALTVSQRSDIRLPEGFDAGQVAQFFDGAIGHSKDTSQILAIADLAIAAAEQSMDDKIGQQRDELRKAERDGLLLNNKVLEAKSRLHAKAVESRLLAEAQTQASQTAEEQLQALLALGKPKPPANEGDSSPS